MTFSISDPPKGIDRVMLNACSTQFSFVDSTVLCESISALKSQPVVTAQVTQSLEQVLEIMVANKSSCIAIVDDRGVVKGIFSERDFVHKVAKNFQEHRSSPIRDFMTPEPIVVTSECTLAYAMTLMSQGGFRNLPVVDGDNRPIAMATIRDLIDFIVGRFMEKLLSFPSGGQ
jgi:CBS domain-containing protein